MPLALLLDEQVLLQAPQETPQQHIFVDPGRLSQHPLTHFFVKDSKNLNENIFKTLQGMNDNMAKKIVPI
jgi:hypothetical protein